MYRPDQEVLDAPGQLAYGGGWGWPRATRAQKTLKRILDVLGSVVFLLLFLPLFVSVALAVRLSSRGPVFFSQPRVGRGGRTFRFYKFRSMVQNSDEVLTSFLDSDQNAREEWAAFQKLNRDPRITAVGRFIRRTSLDELPQFWNVLKGDMSLVGPRPVTASERSRYGGGWEAYCSVRPGLTGLWQVSGRSRISYEDRVRIDLQYIQSRSVWLDIKILLRTVKVVITGDGSM